MRGDGAGDHAAFKARDPVGQPRPALARSALHPVQPQHEALGGVAQFAHIAGPVLRTQALRAIRGRACGRRRRGARPLRAPDAGTAAGCPRAAPTAAARAASPRSAASTDLRGSGRPATSAARSVLLVAMNRTSSAIGSFDPSRVITRSCNTRSSFACRSDRHRPDLVQQDRAAARMLEPAVARPQRPGESAGLVAEQFALDQRLGQGGAVDRHKAAWPRAATGRASRAPPLPCPTPVGPTISASASLGPMARRR